MKKKSIIFVLVLTFVHWSFAGSRDTLYFTFNEATSQLTMEAPLLGTGRYPFFYPNQNNFSQWLFITGKNKGCISGDFETGAFIQSRDPQILPVTETFDSLQCTNLSVCIYEEEVRENDKIPIAVSIIHATDSASISKSELIDANGGKTNSAKLIIPMVIVVILIVCFVVVFIIIRKHKKQQDEHKPHPKTGSLEVVEVVKNDQVRGLDFIKNNSSAYYKIDLTKDFVDTAVHNIYIHHTVIKKMYDFFKQSLVSGDVTNETGCYFVGCWEYDSQDQKSYNISLEQIVEPGDDLEPGEFSFNFGLKIGVKLNSTIDKLSHDTGRDYVHTVWMHSHPGLGLFLSSHDLVVQRQLSYSDAKNRLVAFVVDTNTPNLDLAVFSAKTDGTMNNKDNITRLYSLEELYSWSRKAHAAGNVEHTAIESSVAPPPVDLEKYHALQVNHQGNSRTLNVYLGSSVINAIDDILYEFEGKHSLAGYLYGTKDSRGNIVVNDVVQVSQVAETTQTDTAPLGVFIVDDESDYSILNSKYFNNNNVTCAFIGRGSDELLILTRDSNETPFPALADAATCSMKPMKEWLRRRRVYK